MKTWDQQTQAFLQHLGCGPSEAEGLPEPVTAEWIRRDEHVERAMFDAGAVVPFLYHDTRCLFDGEEVYTAEQLRGYDMWELGDVHSVELCHNAQQKTVTVKRRNVTLDRLPRYVKSDIVTGARGGGRFRYRNGK